MMSAKMPRSIMISMAGGCFLLYPWQDVAVALVSAIIKVRQIVLS